LTIDDETVITSKYDFSRFSRVTKTSEITALEFDLQREKMARVNLEKEMAKMREMNS